MVTPVAVVEQHARIALLALILVLIEVLEARSELTDKSLQPLHLHARLLQLLRVHIANTAHRTRARRRFALLDKRRNVRQRHAKLLQFRNPADPNNGIRAKQTILTFGTRARVNETKLFVKVDCPHRFACLPSKISNSQNRLIRRLHPSTIAARASTTNLAKIRAVCCHHPTLTYALGRVWHRRMTTSMRTYQLGSPRT